VERLTDMAQGYCEVYCDFWDKCTEEPENCQWKNEVNLYNRLREYEASGLEPEEIVGLKNSYEQLNASFDQIFRANDAMGKELDAYKRTGMEPCDYSAMSHALQKAKKAEGDLNELICIVGGVGFSRIKELAQAEQEGRLVVLLFAPGVTLIDHSDPERPELLKNFRLAVAYDHNGIVFHQPLGIFLENVKRGYVAQVSEETEKALRGGL